MLYEYECDNCNRIYEHFHAHDEYKIITCPICGARCFKLISRGAQICGVNGRADMYNFVDFNTTGKPVVINSKTQWRNHLKAHGLNDDVKNDPLTKADVESMQRSKVNEKIAARRSIKEKVTDVVRNIPSSKLKERAKQVMKKGG